METFNKTSLKNAANGMLIAAIAFLSSCDKNSNSNPVPANLKSSATTFAANSKAIGVSGPKSVCYMEVNNYDFRDVGKYTLSTGQQLFDIGIIFAANINLDASTGKAVLYYNAQVTNVLSNASTYIQPVQAKGIKVLLSILGNHAGVGICNFQSQADAQAFAQQLSNAVTTYGLDGIDFDDEYADYPTSGSGQVNSSSFVYLVTALHQLMPNKIISFYDYGPAASYLSYNGVTVGSQINYSWNAIYGTYSVPNVPGLAKSALAPAAIDVQNTSSSTAASLATKTVSNGYGVYLYYNLPDADSHTYLSSVSNKLYGKSTVFSN